MEQYEKPNMEIISLTQDIMATASCEGGYGCEDDYECDTETPPICIWGDDGLSE